MEETNKEPKADLKAQDEPKKEQSLEEQVAFWKKTSREWESKCKENKNNLSKLQQQNESQLSESEKLQKRLEALEKDCAEKNRLIDVARQAKEHGVNSDVLSRMNGSTLEEISENAQMLKKAMEAQSNYSATPDGGEAKATPISKAEILEMKDDKERLKAIQEHIDLF